MEFRNPASDNYRKRTEEKSVLSDYSFEGNLNAFGLTGVELAGKKILDLGSGKTEDFSRGAAKFGAEVVSLNPKMEDKQLLFKLPDWQHSSVAGRAQEIPFRPETFDIVVSYWAIPIWLPKETREQFEQEIFTTIREVYKLLKPGGRFYFYPLDVRNLSTDEEILVANLGERTLEFLSSNKAVCRLEYHRKDPSCIIEKK